MSERKAYRVRQSRTDRGYFGTGNPDYPYGGHPYTAIPWPEDCPWDPEDFPLPGETVVDIDGDTLRIEGEPKCDGHSWRVPVSLNDSLWFEDTRAIPAIWNARKDAEPEVVGTLSVGGDNHNYVQVSTDKPLRAGTYKIIRDD